MDGLESYLFELTSGDDQRAEAAAEKLALFGNEALAALLPLLADERTDQRWWAVRTLANIHNGEASLHLIQALNDPDLSVRQCAALGLHQCAAQERTGCQGDEAIQALIAAMSEQDHLLVRLAANALVSIGAPAVPALIEQLENAAQLVRLEAVRALALIGDPRAIPVLFDALESDSALADYWANEGLERMGVGMVFFKP